MRVGLANETDSPGGAETMLLELARELQARGHEVVALGTSGGEGWLTARFADMGIERELVDVRGPSGLGVVPQIASVLRARRIDVLHSHDFGMAVCGAFGARLAGCRHVITMHGGPYYSSSLKRRLSLRLAMALSSRTVAVSYALRQTLAGFLAFSAGSIDVIHNGIASAQGGFGLVREELGVGPSDVLLLAVGNLKPVKGHSILLEAVSKLPPCEERVVVAIAGSGPEEANLRSLARDLGIAEDVHLLGYRADIRELLHGADVFVMPSLSEGLPMAMIEAMLAGKAIVASDAGGIRELLGDSEVGILVQPRDTVGLAAALADLIGAPDSRERLGDAALARGLEHFTASAMAERYLSIYRD